MQAPRRRRVAGAPRPGRTARPSGPTRSTSLIARIEAFASHTGTLVWGALVAGLASALVTLALSAFHSDSHEGRMLKVYASALTPSAQAIGLTDRAPMSGHPRSPSPASPTTRAVPRASTMPPGSASVGSPSAVGGSASPSSVPRAAPWLGLVGGGCGERPVRPPVLRLGVFGPRDTSIVIWQIVVRRGTDVRHTALSPAAAHIGAIVPAAPCRFVKPIKLSADLSSTTTAIAGPWTDDALEPDEAADFDVTVKLPPGPCTVTAEVDFRYSDTGEEGHVSQNLSPELCPEPAPAPSRSIAS